MLRLLEMMEKLRKVHEEFGDIPVVLLADFDGVSGADLRQPKGTVSAVSGEVCGVAVEPGTRVLMLHWEDRELLWPGATVRGAHDE